CNAAELGGPSEPGSLHRGGAAADRARRRPARGRHHVGRSALPAHAHPLAALLRRHRGGLPGDRAEGRRREQHEGQPDRALRRRSGAGPAFGDLRPSPWRTVLGLACGAGLAVAVAAPGEAPADLLLVNGRVYTLAWDEPAADGTPARNAPHSAQGWHPDVEAGAVRGERIVFAGSASAAAAYRGPSTQVLDVNGATVIPGLVDAHTHVAVLGEKRRHLDLVGVADEAEAIARVVARAAQVPKGGWIV